MNALQLWILVGLMVSGGLVIVGWYFGSAQPDLADALGRIAPATGSRQLTTAYGDRAELADRLGLWAMRHLPTTADPRPDRNERTRPSRGGDRLPRTPPARRSS